MEFNFKSMVLASNKKALGACTGVLLFCISLLGGCADNNETSIYLDGEIPFLEPVDTLTFHYENTSIKANSTGYSENRYGQVVLMDSNNNWHYWSIDSDKQLHHYDFRTGVHSYSDTITGESIQAYKLDASFIYLLYGDYLYVKDYTLHSLDSFPFPRPVIDQMHGIDFSIENSYNLVKTNQYFMLMYYVVDKQENGTSRYRNTYDAFYFFNRDTSFFAIRGCVSADSVFQYFRYPALTYDGEYLYAAPRVKNCIARFSESLVAEYSVIEEDRNNYLTLEHADQYEISKLKKYRFSSDYNRDILIDGHHVYLIKEVPRKIYLENGVRMYDRILKVVAFNKDLSGSHSAYLEDQKYQISWVHKDRLYLFDFSKNYALVYEI